MDVAASPVGSTTPIEDSGRATQDAERLALVSTPCCALVVAPRRLNRDVSR